MAGWLLNENGDNGGSPAGATTQTRHLREVLLKQVKKPPDKLLTRSGIVWSSPDVSIKHSYLLGLEKVDSLRHSDTMGGVRFRR